MSTLSGLSDQSSPNNLLVSSVNKSFPSSSIVPETDVSLKNIYEKTVGGKPVINICMGGQKVLSLIDTGSQVSMVSQAWFQKNINSSLEQLFSTTDWIKITGANGLNIPYAGLWKTSIVLRGKVLPEVGILVVKDSQNGVPMRTEIPGVIGMNILQHFSEFKELLSTCSKKHDTESSEVNSKVYVKLGGCEICVIPVGHVCLVPVNIGVKSSDLMYIEPLEMAVQGSLYVCPGVVSTDKTCLVPVVNMSTNKEVTISPGTKLGLCNPVDSVSQNELTINCNSDEVVVSFETSTVTEVDESCKSSDYIPHVTLSGIVGDLQDLDQIKELFKKHRNIFSKPDEPLGSTSTIKHKINTVDDVPVVQPYRRIPPHLWEPVQKHLQDLKNKGIIKESCSDYASPIVIVKKKNGDLRICVDYRKLNLKVQRDSFPLPRIEESLDSLTNAKYFSTLDLTSAYHQIEVAEEDQKKTAFITPMGLFEYIRMPFGLSTSPATFQRLMNIVFRDDIFKTLLVYLDDIIVFSSTISEHLERLEHVFCTLKKHNLKLKAEKCNFFKKEVNYLGHVVTSEGIKTDPEKVSVIKQYQVPKTLYEIRKFLGFASYYRRFVPKFASIAAPLYELISITGTSTKGRKVKGQSKLSRTQELPVWEIKHQSAFDTLKQKLISAPILSYADFTQPFILETDASENGLGAVLSQDIDGERRVIAYASRGLRGAEKNKIGYSSRKLELLALKWAVTVKFRDYLLGSHFTVITDNNPLTYVMQRGKLQAIEQRWVAELAPFNFGFKFRSGKENTSADFLSRIKYRPWDVSPDDISEICAVNNHSVNLNDQLFVSVLESVLEKPEVPEELKQISTSLPQLDYLQLAKLQDADPIIGRLKFFWNKGKNTNLHSKEK